MSNDILELLRIICHKGAKITFGTVSDVVLNLPGDGYEIVLYSPRLFCSHGVSNFFEYEYNFIKIGRGIDHLFKNLNFLHRVMKAFVKFMQFHDKLPSFSFIA